MGFSLVGFIWVWFMLGLDVSFEVSLVDFIWVLEVGFGDFFYWFINRDQQRQQRNLIYFGGTNVQLPGLEFSI